MNDDGSAWPHCYKDTQIHQVIAIRAITEAFCSLEPYHKEFVDTVLVKRHWKNFALKFTATEHC